MTGKRGGTNWSALAKHNAAVLATKHNTPSLKTTPIKEWPAARRDVGPVFVDLLTQRVAQLEARQSQKPEGVEPTPQRESTETEPQPNGPAQITNMHDGFRLGTQEQQQAARDVFTEFMGVRNFMQHSAQHWANQGGDGMAAAVRNLRIVTEFTLGVLNDSHLDRLDPDDQQALLEFAQETRRQAMRLENKTRRVMKPQEARTS